MLTRRNPRRRPSHPGAMLRDMVLPPLGISKTRLARALGLSRYELCEILARETVSHARYGFEAGIRSRRVGAIMDEYAERIPPTLMGYAPNVSSVARGGYNFC